MGMACLALALLAVGIPLTTILGRRSKRLDELTERVAALERAQLKPHVETAPVPVTHFVDPELPAPLVTAPLAPFPAPNWEAPGPVAPSFEERLGTWLPRIGATIALFGVAWFFKYAVDQGWVGPWARVLFFTVVGVGTLAFSQWQRASAKPAFTQLLGGVAFSILYFSAYAASSLYDLVPLEAAFVSFFIISLLGGALAIAQRTEALLAYSTAGAFAAPVLFSTGHDRALALFGYLALVSALTFYGAIRRAFLVAPWVPFTGTVVLATGWYVKFFHPQAPDNAYRTLDGRLVPLLALGIFTALWLWVDDGWRRAGAKKHADALLALTTAFAFLAGSALTFDAPFAVSVIILALTLAADFAGTFRQLPALRLWSLLAGAAAWLPVVDRAEYTTGQALPATVLGALSVWAAFHFFSSLRRLAKGQAMAGLDIAVPSAAGIALVAYGVSLLENSTDFQRAVVLTTAGVFHFVLGAVALRRSAPKWFSSAALGQAVALFASAIGVLLSGVALTFAWAVGAAVIVYLAMERDEPVWLAGAGVLFLAAIAHCVGHDVRIPETARTIFFATRGQDGAFAIAPLLNARSLSLLALALSLGASAYFTSLRPGTAAIRASAATFLVGAHLFLLTLLVFEVRELAIPWPALPGPDALDALWDELSWVASSHRHRLNVATTVTFGTYAAILVALGFWARNRPHRYLGLFLSTVAVLKLVFVDIWSMPGIFRAVVGMGLGVLLLGVGLLYARYGKRLVDFVKEGA